MSTAYYLRVSSSSQDTKSQEADLKGHASTSPDAGWYRDKFTGKASLRISPPQRFSPRIAGWNFTIAEKPGPGEYRYLRFAWKSPTGTGIMLELADNGAWPKENETRGRLVSGKNTTKWQAVQVSDQVPREWVVVTRDLWKEFGPMKLTGIAPTALGGGAYFDRIELLQTLEDIAPPKK